MPQEGAYVSQLFCFQPARNANKHALSPLWDAAQGGADLTQRHAPVQGLRCGICHRGVCCRNGWGSGGISQPGTVQQGVRISPIPYPTAADILSPTAGQGTGQSWRAGESCYGLLPSTTGRAKDKQAIRRHPARIGSSPVCRPLLHGAGRRSNPYGPLRAATITANCYGPSLRTKE